ncbi:rCG49702 [Rattus norvegicus]|uniref:RCG49702 n=1 Tax=Rattus norvegicus TaxID=10116 RepID=A6K2D7_RAT|nr:rCG49702 [Rattus norvegicus]
MKVERSLHPSRRTKSQRPVHTRIQEEPSTSQQSRPSGAHLVREQMNKNDNPSAPAAAEAVPPCPNIASVPIEAVDIPTPQVGPKS